MVSKIGFVLLATLATSPAHGVSPATCEASPEIRTEIAGAIVVAPDPSEFEKHVAPLRTLRQRHPQDVIAHELYQDAVQNHGIEGHLRQLTEEYQVLSMQHPDELMYDYLYARSLIGRNTREAIRQINQLLAQHPEFAPAHRSLEAIYDSAAFRDVEKEKAEQARFRQLCPGSALQHLPAPLPDPSPLVDQAEAQLAGHGEPERILAMAQQGIRDDEWRLQRIRPFDWYTVEFKRQSQVELREKYWKMWSVEVRCDRLEGRQDKAAEVLSAMDQRADLLARHSDPLYWNVRTTLARLYEEGKRKDLAAKEFDSMEQFLSQHPDPQRRNQLQELRVHMASQ